MNVFDSYKLPVGLTDGVEVELGDTGAKFMVLLPSNLNEDFQMEVFSKLNMKLGAGDSVEKFKFDPIMLQRVRKELFFATCIKSYEGLPDGMNDKEFFSKYPLAAREILEKATALANESDAKLEDAMGNSSSSLNGKSSGKVEQLSMKNSSKPGSKSKQNALI